MPKKSIPKPSPNGKLSSSTSTGGNSTASVVAERNGRAGQNGRDGRLFGRGVIAEVARFLGNYIVLPEQTILVTAAWVVASWFAEIWDRFPHLAVTSPEKRCGKTRLLQLLELVVPNPYNTSNISPAAIYRLIASVKPTLLFDEAQSITRLASESSEVIRELFNAGIDKNARVIRCSGSSRDKVESFPIYSPKVIALIGDLDGVLADRCLPIALRRKSNQDRAMQPYRSRIVGPFGQQVGEKIEQWAKENSERVAQVYDSLEPFPSIQNDRMAELFLPLQAVLTVDTPDNADGWDGVLEGMPDSPLEMLKKYAEELDSKDCEQESSGVQLLKSTKDIFSIKYVLENGIPTATLIQELCEREEEPWGTWSRGEPITAEALARLLRPYGVRSQHNKQKNWRGYWRTDLQEPWDRYLPHMPLKKPSHPSHPSD